MILGIFSNYLEKKYSIWIQEWREGTVHEIINLFDFFVCFMSIFCFAYFSAGGYGGYGGPGGYGANYNGNGMYGGYNDFHNYGPPQGNQRGDHSKSINHPFLFSSFI